MTLCYSLPKEDGAEVFNLKQETKGFLYNGSDVGEDGGWTGCAERWRRPCRECGLYNRDHQITRRSKRLAHTSWKACHDDANLDSALMLTWNFSYRRPFERLSSQKDSQLQQICSNPSSHALHLWNLKRNHRWQLLHLEIGSLMEMDLSIDRFGFVDREIAK